MNIKISDNKVITILLIAFVVQVLALLWHLGWVGPLNEIDSVAGQPAGYVERLENNLKKRPINNLIWDNSNEKDKISYYDSLLTLSRSSAKIHLNNGTEIHLAENTLITIEPPEPSFPDEIRIQFSKGHVQARNAFRKSTIKDEKMTLVVNKSSQVDLIKNKNGAYEVVVKKGQAEIKTNTANEVINENQVVTLDEQQNLQKSQLDLDLQWDHQSKVRAYTHSSTASIPLTWKGKASTLLVQRKGLTFREIQLTKNQTNLNIELPLGDYRAFLIEKNKQSRRIDLEARSAPTIHLISPLPRDRVSFGKMSLLWENNAKAHSYEVRFYGKVRNRNWRSEHNSLEIFNQTEDEVLWEVWGRDEEGFLIPPAYQYPLYIRKNLFSPPKLKKVTPKPNRDHVFYNWIIPSAHAVEQTQALMVWEPVPYANLYSIEISESPDFRVLAHKKKTSLTSYHWQGADKNIKYYWRVAAGNSSGLMGAFSEPALLEWSLPIATAGKVKKTLGKKNTHKSQQRTNTPIKRNNYKGHDEYKGKAFQINPQEKTKKEVSTSKNDNDKARTRGLKSFYLAYSPNYTLKNYNSPSNTKTNINGLSPFGFYLQTKFAYSTGLDLNFKASVNQAEFKPSGKSKNDFQSNIKTREVHSMLTLESVNSGWGLGLFVADLPFSARKDFEEIQINQSFGYGVVGTYSSQIYGFDYWGTFGPSKVSSYMGLYTSHRLLRSVFNSNFKTGLEIEGYFQIDGSHSSSIYNLTVHFGWGF